MKCPQCVAENKKSILRSEGSSRTLLYCPSFYDEDGNFHHHDRNTTRTDYKCSNGHSFIETNDKSPCPTCGDKWYKNKYA